MKKSVDLVLGVFSMAFGVAIIAVGKNTKLQFYSGTTPGPAFLPYIAAWGIGLCGLILVAGFLMKSAKAADAGRETESDAKAIWIFKLKDLRNILIVLGASTLMMYLTKYLGMLLSFALGIAVMAKFLGTPGWRTPAFVGVLSWVVLYLIFDLFLKTPLPRGILGL